jgi:hypothetical protein
VHTLEEILEKECREAVERKKWYERVMNSPDEPDDVIKRLCVQLMGLERALDQFDMRL